MTNAKAQGKQTSRPAAASLSDTFVQPKSSTVIGDLVKSAKADLDQFAKAIKTSENKDKAVVKDDQKRDVITPSTTIRPAKSQKLSDENVQQPSRLPAIGLTTASPAAESDSSVDFQEVISNTPVKEFIVDDITLDNLSLCSSSELRHKVLSRKVAVANTFMLFIRTQLFNHLRLECMEGQGFSFDKGTTVYGNGGGWDALLWRYDPTLKSLLTMKDLWRDALIMCWKTLVNEGMIVLVLEVIHNAAGIFMYWKVVIE